MTLRQYAPDHPPRPGGVFGSPGVVVCSTCAEPLVRANQPCTICAAESGWPHSPQCPRDYPDRDVPFTYRHPPRQVERSPRPEYL